MTICDQLGGYSIETMKTTGLPSLSIDIAMGDRDERTPLHRCSLGGHAEIVQ